MKIKILILLTFLTTELFAKDRVDTSIVKKIDRIQENYLKKSDFEEKISILKDKIDNEERLHDKTLDSISAQIAASSYNLAVFGIVFGILAIGLGVYVTFIERKIVKVRDENKDLLLQNQKIKSEVLEVNKLIQSDIYGLFLKIKREESVHILERLIKIPKDITNVCQSLLSRDLIPEDFSKLKQAYDKLRATTSLDEGEENHILHYTEEYKLVFFQHFLNQVMRDEDLKKDMTDYVYFGIQSAFENDILKSTNDLITAVVDLGLHNFSAVLNKYFEGMSSSEHKNFSEVYQLLFDKLQNRKNRFDLYGIIQTGDTTRKAKINYGHLLAKTYSTDNPTDMESRIFKENEVLIADEAVAQEAIKVQIEKSKVAAAEKAAKIAERKAQREAADNRTKK